MKKILNSILAILLMIIFLAYCFYKDFIVPNTTEKEATLSKCIDGDTAEMIINGNKERIRFLAIDTPESVDPNKPAEPYAKETASFTCNLLKNANEITLEIEENAKKDKYDRLLAWVWVDSNLVQMDLIENGLAEVKYLYDDYKYTDLLIDAQKEAKSKKIGIWNK